MRRGLFVYVTVGALLFGLVGPASADVAVVGALVGEAAVGQWFTSGNACTQDGLGVPGGRGVAPAQGSRFSREGTWSLTTTLVAAGQQDLEPGVWDGTIHICGRLNPEPVDDIGPVCGVSKGFGGKGRAFGIEQSVFGRVIDLRLYDFGWKEQAGAILPVIGKFEQRDTFGNDSGVHGTVVALVAVAPSLASFEECFDLGTGNGVQNFAVVASFAAITSDPNPGWNELTQDLFPKTGTREKTCYDNGPAAKTASPEPSTGSAYC